MSIGVEVKQPPSSRRLRLNSFRERVKGKKKVDDSLARSTTLDGSSCRSSGLCSPPSSGDGGEMNRLCVAHHQTNTVSLRKKLKEEEEMKMKCVIKRRKSNLKI